MDEVGKGASSSYTERERKGRDSLQGGEIAQNEENE